LIVTVTPYVHRIQMLLPLTMTSYSTYVLDPYLDGSFVNDGEFADNELCTMAENWVDIEDDPLVVDIECEEALKLLD